jgi:hypothetical protein
LFELQTPLPPLLENKTEKRKADGNYARVSEEESGGEEV